MKSALRKETSIIEESLEDNEEKIKIKADLAKFVKKFIPKKKSERHRV